MKAGQEDLTLSFIICWSLVIVCRLSSFVVCRLSVIVCRDGVTYMAEMSLEAKERGPEVSYQLALLITGVALAYWVGHPNSFVVMSALPDIVNR